MIKAIAQHNTVQLIIQDLQGLRNVEPKKLALYGALGIPGLAVSMSTCWYLLAAIA